MRCASRDHFFKKPNQFVFWAIHLPKKHLDPRQTGAKPGVFQPEIEDFRLNIQGVLDTPWTEL